MTSLNLDPDTFEEALNVYREAERLASELWTASMADVLESTTDFLNKHIIDVDNKEATRQKALTLLEVITGRLSELEDYYHLLISPHAPLSRYIDGMDASMAKIHVKLGLICVDTLAVLLESPISPDIEAAMKRMWEDFSGIITQIYSHGFAYTEYISHTQHCPLARYGGQLMASTVFGEYEQFRAEQDRIARVALERHLPTPPPKLFHSKQLLWALQEDDVLPDNFWKEFFVKIADIHREGTKDFFTRDWFHRNDLESTLRYGCAHSSTFRDSFIENFGMAPFGMNRKIVSILTADDFAAVFAKHFGEIVDKTHDLTARAILFELIAQSRENPEGFPGVSERNEPSGLGFVYARDLFGMRDLYSPEDFDRILDAVTAAVAPYVHVDNVIPMDRVASS